MYRRLLIGLFVAAFVANAALTDNPASSARAATPAPTAAMTCINGFTASSGNGGYGSPGLLGSAAYACTSNQTLACSSYASAQKQPWSPVNTGPGTTNGNWGPFVYACTNIATANSNQPTSCASAFGAAQVLQIPPSQTGGRVVFQYLCQSSPPTCASGWSQPLNIYPVSLSTNAFAYICYLNPATPAPVPTFTLTPIKIATPGPTQPPYTFATTFAGTWDYSSPNCPAIVAGKIAITSVSSNNAFGGTLTAGGVSVPVSGSASSVTQAPGVAAFAGNPATPARVSAAVSMTQVLNGVTFIWSGAYVAISGNAPFWNPTINATPTCGLILKHE